MKTILQVKLYPDDKQKQALLDTMYRFNEACNYIAEQSFDKDERTSKFKLQQLYYHDIKKKYNLTAQIVILAIRKVTDCYKRDKNTMPVFRKDSCVIYDQRVYSFKGVEKVSLWTVEGRLKISVIMGEYQKKRWLQKKGQADLVYRKGCFYLLVTVDTPEEPPMDSDKFIGVDLGINNIAVDSTGEFFSGNKIEAKRKKYAEQKSALQKCGSKSAKRHLKKLKNREARFKKDVNHCVAKKIVKKAKDTESGIALEELTHIRKRTTVRKSMRSKHSSWSFGQLRSFIEYKAKLAGIKTALVNPKYTSQRCSDCGYIHKNNRKTQSEFICGKCGNKLNADYNASLNISFIAEVIQRIVGSVEDEEARKSLIEFELTYKPLALAMG